MNVRGGMQSRAPSSLTCIQANLRHGRASSGSFAQLLLDLNVDVALVQEPSSPNVSPPPGDSHSRSIITYLPDGFQSFQSRGLQRSFCETFLTPVSRLATIRVHGSMPGSVSSQNQTSKTTRFLEVIVRLV